MLDSAQSVLRRLAAETRGAEIAEAAAVLPVMFMVLLGIFWFGQAFSTYGTITRAAQEGARAAAAPVCTTCAAGSSTAGKAFTAIQGRSDGRQARPAKMQYPTAIPNLLACRTGSAVTCDGSQSKVCVQQEVALSFRLGGGVGVCGTSVSFQYPFQFWLPFTSLNKQRILLNASARVRSESH